LHFNRTLNRLLDGLCEVRRNSQYVCHDFIVLLGCVFGYRSLLVDDGILLEIGGNSQIFGRTYLLPPHSEIELQNFRQQEVCQIDTSALELLHQSEANSRRVLLKAIGLRMIV
jgi:hypothetical protein